MDEQTRKRWEGELFRLLAENVKDYAIFILDPEGHVLTWSSGAERLLGYTEAEIVGQSAAVFFTPEDQEKEEPQRERRLASETGRGEDDRWHVKKDGSRFWCSGVLTPLRNGGGELLGFAKIMRDLTERKLHEEQQRQSEEQLRAFFETAAAGMAEADPQTRRLLRVNGTLSRLLGYSRDELLAMTVPELTHPDDRQEDQRHFDRMVRGETPSYESEKRYLRKDGAAIWCHVSVSLIRDAEGRPERTASVVVNVNERRHAVESLQQASRNKDEFLAMLGHELRNPLAPMLNAVQILQRGGGDDTVRQHVSYMIERQVRHMTRLVDDLLEVARISRGKIELKVEAAELTAIVLRAVETSRNLIDNRRHHLSLSLPDEPIWIRGDPTRLEQVITNLLNNAAKYTDEGGEIGLAVERREATAVIRVQDNGIGIEPEVLPQVFELFTQASHALDRSHGGLGVGLTLVKTLAEMHGGSVEAASTGRGQGSAFTVRLPVLDVAPTPQAATSAAGQAAAPALRVLVVDDNNDAADSVRMLLQLHGHQVIVAHTGPTALQQAESWRPHAVLLDIGLPGIDGYEVARRLRASPQTEKAFIIAMTGYGQEADRQRSKSAGMDVHLVKPVDPDDLERLLAEVQAT